MGKYNWVNQKRKRTKVPLKQNGKKAKTVLSGTDTSDLPVPETSQTGSLKVTTSNPTKVDLPGLRISTSLGQAAATTTSTTDLQPAASSGTASACQDSTPDQDLPYVESLPSGGILGMEKFQTLKHKSRMRR